MRINITNEKAVSGGFSAQPNYLIPEVFMSVASYPQITFAKNYFPVVLPIRIELVRGSEETFLHELLPRVKQESVALDLSAVDRIDAAGIAALITLYCTSIESGTTFSIVEPSHRVLELLHVVGLDSILIHGSGSATEHNTCLDKSAA